MSPGELIFHFLNTVVLTALVASGVLWRYRVDVLAGMGSSSGQALGIPAVVPARTVMPQPPAAGLAWEKQARRRIALAYLGSVAVPALGLAVLQLHVGNLPRTPAHVMLVGGSLLLAAVPMIAVSLALRFRQAVGLGLGVLIACAVLGTGLSMLQRPFMGGRPSLDQLLNFFTFFHFAAVWLPFPLTLIVLTGHARIRGVAPITFAGLLLFGLAPLLGARASAWLATTPDGSRILLDIGLNAVFMVLALPAALLGWWRLQGLAGAYQAKRFSDAQLLARTWWLLFCAALALELINAAPDRWWLVLAGCVAAYAVFPWLNGVLLARAVGRHGRPPRRTLLLLRVFGYTARTEKLFDRVGARWRLFGPVTMIAAPDVMARTIDPGDFLRFAGGRLASSFVTSRVDLNAGLAALDQMPDPDGRYRVNEFCCRDDTWKATVVELMDRADVILMDLRGLTPTRGGCEFELKQLNERLPANRVVLVVDSEAVVAQVAALMSRLPVIVRFDKGSATETETLFATLLRAAELLPAPRP